ncbi:MAG TPA: hypothetical protein VIV40_43840 [Kofleriaceae bacterium]
MKKLVLASLIALVASQAAGCIITSGDDSGDDAFITANWTLRSEASNSTASCPPTYDTAALYNQPIDSAGNSVGQPIIDLFDCVAGHGTSAPLPPTRYLSWVVIANHDNTSQYATSLSAEVDVTAADKTFSTQILVDGGYFQLTWDLKGATSNAPLTCAAAGLTASTSGIQLQAFVSGSNASSADLFTCEDHAGVTAGYVAGNYDVLIDAVDPDPVGSAPQISSSIRDRNQVTNLGNVIIPITGL